MAKSKIKTKKEIEAELAQAKEVWAGLQRSLELTIEGERKEKSDREALAKVIFNIGFLVYGPDWLQHSSYQALYEKIAETITVGKLNAGMYDGMRQAHMDLMGKISARSGDNLKA